MKLRLEKRENVSTARIILISILFAFLAFVFCGIFIAAIGFNPLSVYAKMFSKTFFSLKGVKNMVNASLPLMFCALGVALTFKMNLNNIGAEGQYAMGAIFGGAFVLMGPQIDGIVGSLILIVCCFAGGAVWALLCAIPKAFWDVNEGITTLLLNYVALIILSYLVLGPWQMAGQNVGQTERIRDGLEIPEIGGTGISAGIFLGVAAAVLIHLAYKYTTLGYQLSVIRYSPAAARYAGINIKKNIIMALVISGGLAGLAGYVSYAGVSHRIIEDLPNSAGYTGIVIAYLSRLNPIVIVIVSILFAGLENSSASVQVLGVPSQISTMIQGAVMIFVIAGDFFQRYRIVRRKEVKKS